MVHLISDQTKRNIGAYKHLILVLLCLPMFSINVVTADTDHLINAYYPPLMIDADADLPGISIEILREAAARLGRQTTAEFLPFRRALRTLQHRSDAIQPALYRLPARENQFQWIAKTHDVYDVFLTLGDTISSLEEARKLKAIGVETDASMDVYLSKNGFTNLERVDRPEINAQKLLAGRIDTWALTESLAKWTWKRLGHEKELMVGQIIRSASVYVVSGKSFPSELAGRYRAELEKMRNDGTIESILMKYR